MGKSDALFVISWQLNEYHGQNPSQCAGADLKHKSTVAERAQRTANKRTHANRKKKHLQIKKTSSSV